MLSKATDVWKEAAARQFAEELTAIDDVELMQNFLRDVMTEKEIIEVSARLKAARMLKDGQKYTDIVAATKLSSRTIARISDWMKNGCGGYAAVLKQAHNHRSPERVG